MSKDKIHIDKLFQKLKDHQPDVSSSDWNEINNKLTDAAWKNKFAGYEPAVDKDDFPFIPHPVSDNNSKQGKSIWIAAFLLLFISSILYFALPFIKNKENTGTLQAGKTSDNTRTQILQENSKPENTDKFNSEKDKIADNSLKPESNQIKKSAITYGIGNNSGIDKEISSGNTNAANNNQSEKEDVDLNNFDNSFETGLSSEINAKVNEVKNFQNPPFKLIGNELGVKSKLLVFNKIPEFTENIEETDLAVKDSELISLTNDSTNENKKVPDKQDEKIRKLQFHANIGAGLLSSANPFTDLKGNNAARYFAHLGVTYKKAGIYSGIEQQGFVFTTEQMQILVYDSFPHRNMNGDTIGWFKRNYRDTSISTDLKSEINVISIPVGFSFRILQYKKSSIFLSATGTYNSFKNKGIYGPDENQYTKFYAKEEEIIKRSSLGYAVDVKFAYKITPKTQLTLSTAYFNTKNISKSPDFEVRPSGYSLNLGINYILR